MTTILQFIGVLAALIILHELGHFLACRLFGVEVEEFGIGFPPRLTKLFEANGTEYTLNWLPLGGFVRPKGENDPDVEDGLAAANPWIRIGVLIAGPLMNLLAAVIVYAVIFAQLGVPDTQTVEILEVAPNSPAERAGLQAEDVITKINQVPIDNSDALREEIYSNLGEQISLAYRRGEEIYQVSLVPRENPPEGEGAIGIVMTNPVRDVGVFEALPRGVVTTARHSVAVLSLPAQLIAGGSAEEVGRPVGYKGMYDVYQGATQQELIPGTSSLVNVLFFVAAITISLGVLNLFPIPALDGGRILLVLPEIILKRRVSQKTKNILNAVGFISMILILIYINILDFTSPVQLP
jgi:regulator of sigma E protease